ncbi:hypothetical protein RGQ29_010230 [Quercus rubra]|uniref:KIB1-4 beta-propeller domain-containing protein n=1 Tax=Quercus rubra TaxID=3512 RepID=A0AAN7G085_QUERU|nr:hypothetical protein RGQ29_010230 [Quercus rubra]
MAPDWSSIPVDLLRLVANKVHSLEDYVHFGAVCWSWYHAATSPKNNKLNSLFPWVMLADTENNDSHGFYSLSSNKVYEFDLPEIVGKRCWGSPFGWLVIAGIDNMEIQLFNPLSRASISLPSQTTFMGDENENSIMHYWSVNKVVISSNPPNCIVMAIYSCYTKLAFAKPGDHVWSKIRLDNNIGTGFSDITYFNGDFFIAKCTGQLLVCDFSGIDPVAIEFAPSPPGVAVEARYLPYLVDLGGELCMVFRYFDVIETINNISMKTRSFEVYKLDMNAKTWKQMDSLGDWSLFVGNNYTFSVRDFGYTDCRSSCIYFTHDYCQCSYQISGNDTGIYNYKGGEIHALPVLQDLYSVLRPPLWITPQLF